MLQPLQLKSQQQIWKAHLSVEENLFLWTVMWTGSEEFGKMGSESQTVTSSIKWATIAPCFLGKVAEHVKNLVFLFKILVPSYFASSRKHTRESTIKVWKNSRSLKDNTITCSDFSKIVFRTLFSECLCPFLLHFVILGKLWTCEVYFLICEDDCSLWSRHSSSDGRSNRGILRDLSSSLPIQET